MLLDLFVYPFFHILHLVRDAVSGVICMRFRFSSFCLSIVVGYIFCVPPRFFRGALYLIG